MASRCADPRFFKTKLCPFLERGYCKRGPSCTFAHGETEIRSGPDLEKTAICPKLRQGCDDENCRYAHSRRELRHTDHLYKTRICVFWRRGVRCFQGRFCRHAHGFDELRQAVNESDLPEDELQDDDYFADVKASQPPAEMKENQCPSLTNSGNPVARADESTKTSKASNRRRDSRSRTIPEKREKPKAADRKSKDSKVRAALPAKVADSRDGIDPLEGDISGASAEIRFDTIRRHDKETQREVEATSLPLAHPLTLTTTPSLCNPMLTVVSDHLDNENFQDVEDKWYLTVPPQSPPRCPTAGGPSMLSPSMTPLALGEEHLPVTRIDINHQPMEENSFEANAHGLTSLIDPRRGRESASMERFYRPSTTGVRMQFLTCTPPASPRRSWYKSFGADAESDCATTTWGTQSVASSELDTMLGGTLATNASPCRSPLLASSPLPPASPCWLDDTTWHSPVAVPSWPSGVSSWPSLDIAEDLHGLHGGTVGGVGSPLPATSFNFGFRDSSHYDGGLLHLDGYPGARAGGHHSHPRHASYENQRPRDEEAAFLYSAGGSAGRCASHENSGRTFGRLRNFNCISENLTEHVPSHSLMDTVFLRRQTSETPSHHPPPPPPPPPPFHGKPTEALTAALGHLSAASAVPLVECCSSRQLNFVNQQLPPHHHHEDLSLLQEASHGNNDDDYADTGCWDEVVTSPSQSYCWGDENNRGSNKNLALDESSSGNDRAGPGSSPSLVSFLMNLVINCDSDSEDFIAM